MSRDERTGADGEGIEASVSSYREVIGRTHTTLGSPLDNSVTAVSWLPHPPLLRGRGGRSSASIDLVRSAT
jgi:hypothetical protein